MVLVRFDERKLLDFSSLEEEAVLTVPWQLGGESRKEDDHIIMEFNPDRPDLYSIQGITRAIRQFRELETFRDFEVSKGNNTANLHFVKERPYFLLGIIRNVKIGEYIEEVIDFQEKIHKTIGRNRKVAAIGIHDLSKVRFPISYEAVPRDSLFKPLGGSEEVTLEKFMVNNEKALEYGNLVGKNIPGIIDAGGDIISVPPILNSEVTAVTGKTENLMVDVTGTNERAVLRTLVLILTSLSYPSGIIEDVEISYAGSNGKTRRSPVIAVEKMEIPRPLIKKMLGYELPDDVISRALLRMGYGLDGNSLIVPSYRFDVLDNIDVVEDILKGVGYENIRRKRENFVTYGKGDKLRIIESKIRNLLVGYSMSEVVNSILINSRFTSIYGLNDEGIEILNPVSQEQDLVRTRILPSLMQTLLNNFRNPYPQRIYEIGTVFRGGSERDVLGIAVAHKNASFSEIKGIFIGVMEDLGIENYETKRQEMGPFIPGRLAEITIGGKSAGYFGEIHPKILRELGIKMPVATGELDISEVMM